MIKYNLVLDSQGNVLRVNWISGYDAGCSYFIINNRYGNSESNVLPVSELRDLTEEEVGKLSPNFVVWLLTILKNKEEIVLDSNGDWESKILRSDAS